MKVLGLIALAVLVPGGGIALICVAVRAIVARREQRAVARKRIPLTQADIDRGATEGVQPKRSRAPEPPVPTATHAYKREVPR